MEISAPPRRERPKVVSSIGVKSPFPYFGGKSRAASLIWAGLGDVDNFVEPFAGSLAVLLNRPDPKGVETVNDIDRYICNFWRAVQADPDGVADHADHPVNEADLEARHYWLITKGREQLEALLTDPDAFDAKIAGWWVWGCCSWIGSGWCSGEGPWVVGENGFELRNAGQGVTSELSADSLNKMVFGERSVTTSTVSDTATAEIGGELHDRVDD